MKNKEDNIIKDLINEHQTEIFLREKKIRVLKSLEKVQATGIEKQIINEVAQKHNV